MMGVWEKINKAVAGLGSQYEHDPSVPDDVTLDPKVRSLRRHRRIQLEQDEKPRLQEEIRAWNREQDRKFLRDERPILREGSAILGRRRVPPRRPPGFLGRSRL